MKLFYAPGACSLGIHLLLEEIGQPYDLHRLNIREGDQFKAEYLVVNPKAKVPALARDDGSVLTEFPAIALWLARTYPEHQFLPDDIEGQARCMEMVEFVVNTLHAQGFSRMFRAAKFTPNAADEETVQKTGRDLAVKGFEQVGKVLGLKPFIMGDRLILADIALFYVLFWACDRLNVAVPPNVADYYQRLKARPTAQRVFAQEQIVLG